MAIPPFQEDGSLPSGIHQVSAQEFRKRFGRGPRRAELIAGLDAAILALRRAGCRTLYVNGSFTTANPKPGDYDGCWDGVGVDEDLLDPVFLDHSDGRAAQKCKYRGELFAAQWVANYRGLTYLQFFQLNRLNQPKGIIALDLEQWR